MTPEHPQHDTRRSFVKRACLAGLCACGAAGAAEVQPSTAETEPAQAETPPTMPQKWIATLLPLLAAGDPEDAKRVLKGCSLSHYEDLKMEATLKPFVGQLPEFLGFLKSAWGWVIDYDEAAGVIDLNENKSECVCPLVQGKRGANLGILCYCSEGFAERMFSVVVGAPVRAEVVESILRGGQRCRYRVQLRPGPT